MSVTTTAAIDDPRLLGAAFEGESWATWRAVLRAAEGLPLAADDLARFHAVAERDPPACRVRELWVVAGRRAGKDSIASAIATAAAMGDYRDRLRPGERATVLCLACDRAQARIVHRYIAGYFRSLPLLAPLVKRETDEEIELSTGVEIIVATNSFRAVRGRTIVCAVFDEVAYWRDEESSSPDIETYGAVLPGLVTLPGAMLVGISSPYRRSGLLFDRWRRHYGQPDDDVLVVRGPSTAFNPTLPQSVIDAALERDPEAAAAEWLAEWRSDLADFVSREAIGAVTIAGRYELPLQSATAYFGFCDPSGGSSDAMTLGIAHRDRQGVAILDCVREVRPPFSPEGVVAEFAAVLRRYRISRVTGDRYAGEWPREQFRKTGIHYEPSEKSKSEIYLDALPLINSAKVELLDNSRLIAQLCALERRTSRGGKDSIDHPPGGHDDVTNAALGALLLVGGNRQPMEIAAETVERWQGARTVRTSDGRRQLVAPRPRTIDCSPDLIPAEICGDSEALMDYFRQFAGSAWHIPEVALARASDPATFGRHGASMPPNAFSGSLSDRHRPAIDPQRDATGYSSGSLSASDTRERRG